MVSPPSGGEIAISHVGQPVDRSVCDVPQCEATPVLLASPGSPGRLPGCVSPSLGRPGSVHVPSLSSGWSGDRPCPRVVTCRDDSGCASLAREGVVRRLTASIDPTSCHLDLVGQSAAAAPLQSLPPRRPRVELSRMVTLKRDFRKSGFSGRAAGVLSGCLRESSSRLHQSRWQIFCGWCRGRGVAPVNATVPVVVDFLIYLRQDKGLSVSAVKGHSSALNSVLALKGRDLSSSREITMLLRSFARSVNPVKLRPPAWDVSLVLQSLTGAPYEPCGRARSGFWHRQCSSCWPFPRLSVSVSSTLCRTVSLIPGTGVRCPSLMSRVSWLRLRIPLPLLLGLRAFQYLPYQTREIIAMGDCCVLCGRSSVTLTALLHIVRDVIGCLSPQGVARRRYRRPLAPEDDIARLRALWNGTSRARPRARETRGIAPSLVFKNFAVDQVLKAGTWRRHTTFTRHYLRDLAHRSLDTFHLCPVVAAQAVV